MSLSKPAFRVDKLTSCIDIFECHPLLALQSTLLEYYSQRIRHHANNVMFLENGNTGLTFFKDGVCDSVVSGHLPVHDFARDVEAISYSTDFYTKLKVNLTPLKLRRVVEELAYIRRLMQGAGAFLHVAQQCPGFRNVKIVLLESLPARKVKAWPLPKDEFPITSRFASSCLETCLSCATVVAIANLPPPPVGDTPRMHIPQDRVAFKACSHILS